NRDGLTVLRIATCARGPFFLGEGAEPGVGELGLGRPSQLRANEVVANLHEDRVDDLHHSLLGEIGGQPFRLVDALDQLLLRHQFAPTPQWNVPRSYRARSRVSRPRSVAEIVAQPTRAH